MNLDTNDFRVKPGERVQLKQRPTRTKALYRSEEDYVEQLAGHIEELSSLQTRLYADNRYSLLLVFQSIDTGGKDGAIRHIMSGVNPQGCHPRIPGTDQGTGIRAQGDPGCPLPRDGEALARRSSFADRCLHRTC